MIRCGLRCALPTLLLLAAACKTTDKGRVRPDAKPTSDAQTNLDKGNEALRGKNYPDAEKYFEYVKDKYPFLDAAKEAELRLGDLEYDRDRVTEARDRYNNFVKLHPTHPRVDYAAFRAAFLATWVAADPAVGRAQRERWRATQERRRAES